MFCKNSCSLIVRVTTNYIHLVIWLKLCECLRMIPCEHILSHKRRHRAHRDGQVCSVFSPTHILDPSTHDLMKSTEYAIGPSISVGAGHTGYATTTKTQRSGNVPRSNMAAPLTCFSLLMNVIHSVFENERIKTICYDTLVCV